MDPESSSFRILMFPWLAHGHIFPFLELAKRILKKKNFHILFCSTAVNFTSIQSFIQSNSLETSIDLIELHLPPNPLLPPHYHTTKNLPPHLNPVLLAAFQTAKSSFSDVLKTQRPDLVIYDIFQPWAAAIASSVSIPAVHFVIVGAAARSFEHHNYTRWDDEFPFPELELRGHERRSLDDLMEFLLANVFEKDKDLFFVNFKLSSEVVLLKTSRGLEGKYIDYVSSVSSKRIVAVSPLVTDCDGNEEEDSDILRWLSGKDEDSTVYVSFGSEYFLSEKEIGEIAKGLEVSGVNFVWVIRFVEETTRVEEAVPEGFLERVKERGRVVSGWAPQANILGHRNTGGFVSHCGWSSVNESVYYGVPVIGIPMKYNMFIDAKMLVHAGVCVEVVREENGEFKGEEIAKAINEVFVEEGGEEMRRRAKELSEKMRTEEEQAIGETVECLWQLCCRNKGKVGL